MRVFVAGATGAIGRALLPQLLEAGHEVIAMTRSRERAERLAAAGVEVAVCDAYDPAGVERAVGQAGPEALIHQLTSLPPAITPRRMERQLADNDRIRVEGTRNLVRAAERANVRRIVAQSVAFAYRPEGDLILAETAPLWLDAPPPFRRSVEAVAELELQVARAEGPDGVVLRYGYFYGSGTAYARDGSNARLVRKRQFPIAGGGGGVFSFIHVDDAARATVLALEGKRQPGVYNVTDDEPAPAREWLPVYAQAIGAPKPWRVPAFLARVAAGRYGVELMTRQRGASNAKAKAEFDWQPRFPTWRTGFAASEHPARRQHDVGRE